MLEYVGLCCWWISFLLLLLSLLLLFLIPKIRAETHISEILQLEATYCDCDAGALMQVASKGDVKNAQIAFPSRVKVNCGEFLGGRGIYSTSWQLDAMTHIHCIYSIHEHAL